jgi:hypothetical protein
MLQCALDIAYTSPEPTLSIDRNDLLSLPSLMRNLVKMG